MSITTKLKSIAKLCLRSLPAKPTLLALAAVLPPALRSPIMMRLWGSIAWTLPQGIQLPTTLGFSKKRYLFNSTNTCVVFGKPSIYQGERGALELSKILTKHSCGFVDVGSHLGYFTFYVREYMDSSLPVYLFEPDPDLFDAICDNVSIAGLQNIACFKQAVSHIDGALTFYRNSLNTDMGSILPSPSEAAHSTPVTVESVRFSTFANSHKLQKLCVKVDVENAEFEFIEGAKGAIASIDYLLIEVLGPAQERNFVQQMINEFGFNAYYINDYQLEYAPEGKFSYIHPQWNWLFCRDSPSSLSAKLAGSKLTVLSIQ